LFASNCACQSPADDDLRGRGLYLSRIGKERRRSAAAGFGSCRTRPYILKPVTGLLRSMERKKAAETLIRFTKMHCASHEDFLRPGPAQTDPVVD
jgi:hypothetical protein